MVSTSRPSASDLTTDGLWGILLGARIGLLLVHGVPTSSWLYRRLVDPLVSRGNRVIVPDLLGFGASDKPKQLALYHPRKQGERLIALMDHLGCRRWWHACHDVGGLWTWEVCERLGPSFAE